MKRIFGLGMLLMLVLGAPVALGWAAALPPLTEADKKTKSEGFQALTHFRTRVYGYFMNAVDFYYYRGSNAELQEFLDLFGKTEELGSREVVVHPGRGRVVPIGEEKRVLPADWMITSTPRALLKPAPEGGKPPAGVAITLTIWTGSGIDASTLKFPEGIKVTRFGEG